MRRAPRHAGTRSPLEIGSQRQDQSRLPRSTAGRQ